MWRPGTISALTVQSRLCRDVVLLRLFPSIRSVSRVTCGHVSHLFLVVTCHACFRTETIRHFLAPPIRGVVLQCYGAGNMPSNRQEH